MNITVKNFQEVSYVIGDQSVQFEFGFCESMPEILVKNLLQDAMAVDINQLCYDNSQANRELINKRKKNASGINIGFNSGDCGSRDSSCSKPPRVT